MAANLERSSSRLVSGESGNGAHSAHTNGGHLPPSPASAPLGSPPLSTATPAITTSIHPTAIVDSRATLAPGVVIGPYVIIEGPVQIGANSRILPHCVLGGPTIIGANCEIGPAAYVGTPAQHLKVKAEDAWLTIGDNTVIREGATVHRSTDNGIEHATRIGNNCFLMGGIHVAHDCHLGNGVIMANGSMIAGHIVIGDKAFLGGGSVVHQFVKIGRLAIIRGNEAVSHDIPPFAAVAYGGLKGYNAIGCRRFGFKQSSLSAIRAAYHCIHSHRTAFAALAALRELSSIYPEVQELVDFLASSKRGVPISVRFMHSTAAQLQAAGEG